MKCIYNILLFISFLLSSNVLGQNDSIQKFIKRTIVYDGCEKLQTNKELTMCFSDKLVKKIKNNDYFYFNSLDTLKISQFDAKLTFVVSKDGKIINPEIKETSNPVFGNLILFTFNDVTPKLKDIQPAIHMDGYPVNLVFQLPIKIQYNLEYLFEDEFDFFSKNSKADEIVYFTLLSEGIIYEIRLDRNFQVKMYEKRKFDYFFLGNAMNLYEVETMEPYQSSIEKMKSERKILKAQDEEEKIKIFQNLDNDDWEVFENGVQIEKHKNSSKFSTSKYFDLIFR